MWPNLNPNITRAPLFTAEAANDSGFMPHELAEARVWLALHGTVLSMSLGTAIT